MDDKRTLIVYFSRTGTVRQAALKLAEMLRADCEELIDNTPYKGIMGFLRGGRMSITGVRSQLQPQRYDPQDYDRVVLCTPMWAGGITPALRTYTHVHQLPEQAWVIISAGTAKPIAQLGEAVQALYLRQSEVRDGSYAEKLSAFVEGLNRLTIGKR